MILETVDTPEDVKRLSDDELKDLAGELRKFIVDNVLRTGGHLASSLGVVELTIALLRVFSPPKDAIVWDVGHQAYAYKILTGRRKLFHTLRQLGGISGFPSIKESNYDAFGVGHSSTSISAGLGIKVAKRLKNEDGKVIAVIGDGALTAGEAYEGLNNLGQLKEDMIVILNDNKMSISRNIGAVSSYLTRVTTGETLRRAKERLESVAKRFLGIKLYMGLKRVEDLVVKGLFPPGMMFEDLGLRYIGPIDGHDLDVLIPTLKNISRLKGPTLLHVITEKGKGYKPAERNPEVYHGVSIKHKRVNPTFTRVFSDTIIDIAKNDKRVVGITAAMPSGTGLDRFQKAFPDRFFDVGIAEQHAVTFAAGLAKEGLRPIVAIYSTFLQRAYDQVIHDVAIQNLPVIFAVDRAGIVGADGVTHQGNFDLSYLRPIPNLTIAVPKDEEELRQLLFTAINSNSPFVIRYPRGEGYGASISNGFEKLPVGKWEILKNGNDAVIVATGWEVYQALNASKILREKGLDVGVVNARFIKPLDNEMLFKIAAKYDFIFTAEENTAIGGLGSAVDEFLCKFYKGKIFNIGIPDRFIEHGNQNILRANIGLTADKMAEKILDILKPIKIKLKNTKNT